MIEPSNSDLGETPDLYEFKASDQITKDGHTMFCEDVVKDLNSMNRKIIQQQERIAEFEESLAKIANHSDGWEGYGESGHALERINEIAKR